jgi:hypothetical protein
MKKSRTNKGSLPLTKVRGKDLVKALSPGAKPGVVKQLTLCLFAGFFSEQILEGLVSYVFRLQEIRGAKFTITYLKAMETQLIKHLLSANPNADYALCTTNNHLRWVKRKLKSKFDLNDINVIRLIMTLIGLKQLMLTVCNTELASIDSKVEISKDIQNDLVSSIQKIGLPKFIRKQRTLKLPGYYLSSKAGPNGNALASRLIDTYANRINPAVLNSQRNLAKELYNMDPDVFDDRYQPLADRKYEFKQKPETGKLLYIQEYGKLKCRVAAIVDGVTQELLKPVHDLLMETLSKIPEDCTFNHDKISNLAKQRHTSGQTFYGFSDLSDASDRIPKFLYVHVLNGIRPNLGSLWSEVLTRRFFVDKELSSHMTRKVKYLEYAVGQPMGALSSWPAMALTHHYLVWVAAGSYENARGKYALLGDDIVIFDEQLYLAYLGVLTSIKVPFKPNSAKNYFEFAKRHFINGSEFTGAYINALCEELNSPQTCVLVWSNLYTRGYINCLQVPEKLFSLLKAGKSSRAILKIIPNTVKGYSINQGEFSKKLVHSILGLGNCNYDYPEAEDKAVKLLHLTTSIVLRSEISNIYRQANVNASLIPKEVSNYVKQRQPGFYNDFQTEFAINIEQIVSEHKQLTLSMEAQWKLLYITDKPDIPLLLRPKVPEWIYPFTLGKRNKVKQVMAWRSSYLVKTIRILRSHF